MHLAKKGNLKKRYQLFIKMSGVEFYCCSSFIEKQTALTIVIRRVGMSVLLLYCFLGSCFQLESGHRLWMPVEKKQIS